MDDNQSTTQDAPVVAPEPTEQPQVDVPEPTDEQASAEPQTQDAPTTEAEPVVEEEEDYGYPQYNLPERQGIDFSTLPTSDDGLIDPTALAGSINQQIALAEERATQRAQNAFQEQMAETKAWDKAFEKHPDLKDNKELRDMIQQSRIGQFSEQLNRNIDPAQIKLKTPLQVADLFFKHIGSAKAEGMKQATTNTVVQKSAHIESATRRSDDSGEARAKAYQNINNPNKEVANKARQDILRRAVFGDN